MRKIFSAAAFLIIFLFTTSQAFATQELSLNGIIVGGWQGLFNFKYEKSLKKFVKHSEFKRTIEVFEYHEGHIYFILDDSLYKADENFNILAEIKFKNIRTFCFYKNHLYVSADGSFKCFDRHLKEISSVAYKFQKNAHKMMIIDDIAYLLDNTVKPMFVYKIDISDPANLKTVFSISLSDVNCHLFDQCLSSGAKKWFIFSSSRVFSGRYQRVFTVDNASGASDRKFFNHMMMPDIRRDGTFQPTGPKIPTISGNKYHIVSSTNSHDSLLLLFSNNKAVLGKLYHKSGAPDLKIVKDLNIRLDHIPETLDYVPQNIFKKDGEKYYSIVLNNAVHLIDAGSYDELLKIDFSKYNISEISSCSIY